MARFDLVRVEGVNFDATLLETNDLSTIRGGSLSLLALGVWVRFLCETQNGVAVHKTVFSGASQCAFVVSCADDSAKAELSRTLNHSLCRTPSPQDWQNACAASGIPASAVGKPVPAFAHLTVVVDLVPCDSPPPGQKEPSDQAISKALKIAEARNHCRQYRQWTIDPLPMTKDGRDVGNLEIHGRPGVIEIEHRQEKKKNAPPEDNKTGASQVEKKYLSVAVRCKGDYGRDARQRFYSLELGQSRDLSNPMAEGFTVTDSFRQITDFQTLCGSDQKKLIPLSARQKLAVFYADGNGFGSIRDAVGISRFSEQLKALRTMLLHGVLTWLCDSAKNTGYDSLFAIDHGNQHATRYSLRFETLLWGGDEVKFVMPAWLGLPFATVFDDLCRDWTIDGHPLTHAMGLVIAPAKTPIRQLSALAEKAADGAKNAGLKDKNTLTVEVFESQAVPDKADDLDSLRTTLYGKPEDGTDLAALLAFPGGDSLREGFSNIYHLGTKDSFPRSQLYNALRAAQEKKEPLVGPSKALDQALEDYAKRSGKPLDETLLPPCCVKERSVGLNVALICGLWDYVSLFGTLWPKPPATKGDEETAQ